MLPRIKEVEYLGEYKLKLWFTNGKIKVVNLEEMLKGAKNMFLQLRNLEYFKRVECDGYSICWPNGVDFCPDMLYSMGESVHQVNKSRKKQLARPRQRKKPRSSV